MSNVEPSADVIAHLLTYLDRNVLKNGNKIKAEFDSFFAENSKCFLKKHKKILENGTKPEYGFIDTNWSSLFRAIEIVLWEVDDYRPANGKKPTLKRKAAPAGAAGAEAAGAGAAAPLLFADLPDKKYNLIYCDPPWSYNNDKSVGLQGLASAHYSTVSLNKLCQLDVPAICEKDCIMLTWCVWPKLGDALKLMEAWKFNYVSSFLVWLKLEKSGNPRLNIGWWLRSNTEFVIVGTKGNVSALKNKDFLCRTSQILQTTDGVEVEFGPEIPVIETIGRGVHSRKPEEVRVIIEKAFPHAKKIELFARGPVEGWDVWGNQAGSEMDVELAKKLASKEDATNCSDAKRQKIGEFFKAREDAETHE